MQWLWFQTAFFCSSLLHNDRCFIYNTHKHIALCLCKCWLHKALFRSQLKMLHVALWSAFCYIPLHSSLTQRATSFRNVSQVQVIQMGWNSLPTRLVLVSSADNFYKQFGTRSGPTYWLTWSRSKLFDTLMVILIFFLSKSCFWKKSADDKKACKISQGEEW